MKKFTIIQESEEIKNVETLKKALDIKNSKVEIKESKKGNNLYFDIEISFSKDLKRLKSSAIADILKRLNGYILKLKYDEKENKMLINFMTFQHLI